MNGDLEGSHKALVWKSRELILVEHTIGYESDIFTPDNWYICVLATTHKSVFHLFHGSIVTEQLPLSVPERWTCLYQADGLNARCQWFEVENCLQYLTLYRQ